MKGVAGKGGVRPRSQVGTVSGQGSKGGVDLTLAGMTVPKPRDADVVEAADLPSVAEREEGVLGASYRALSVGIVSVVLLIAFEATAVGTAMPVAARELDGVSLYAFAFSGYFTTSLFGMVLSGQWSDRRGPLGPLTTGIASFGAGLLLSGTAGSMWVFILGRAVQGFGGGLVIVALYVVVGRAYPERLRPAIMAAFAASWVLPSIVGPLAAGSVTEQLGWRWVFVGIPVLVVLPLALALPATLGIAPLAVVTQTLVELVAMVVLVRLVPRFIPERVNRGRGSSSRGAHDVR